MIAKIISVDRRLSFGGITIMANEPRSGVETHFARLNGELLQMEKVERERR